MVVEDCYNEEKKTETFQQRKPSSRVFDDLLTICVLADSYLYTVPPLDNH